MFSEVDLVLTLAIVVIYISAFHQVAAVDEFRTYLIGDLIANDFNKDCDHRISMYEDWVFGGQLSYVADDVDTHCDVYTLQVVADYPDSVGDLRLMFRVDRNDTYSTLISEPASSFHLHFSDLGRLNKSVELSNNSSDVDDTYVTADNILIVTFSTHTTVDWNLTFTSFHTGLCHSYEYMCANKRCIFHSLICNGHNPCADNSDCNITPVAIATLVLGGFCTLGVLLLVLYVCARSGNMSNWSSRDKQPRTFSPAKALQSVQAFTPATITFTPLHRKWSIQ